MFQYYRTVIGFIFIIVFFQAIYYIYTTQMRQQNKHFQTLPNENRKSVAVTFVPKIDSVIPLQLRTNNSNNQFTMTSIQTLVTTAPIAFSVPDPSNYSNLLPCETLAIDKNSTTSVKYQVDVSKTLYSYDELEKKLGFDINTGGHWYPSNCQSNQRLAVVICYRDREQHLQIFLNNIHLFLKQQQLDYAIIVVNQHGKEPFNRGALFNVGYIEAMKLYPFTCFIFHDVDLLPEDLRNTYKCGSLPRHMSVAVDKFNYKLLYPTLFGGVTAFHIDDFVRTNGFPNVYWGWGNEDDDMYLRVTKRLKKSITRYPIEIARYKMIRTHGHKSGVNNPYRDKILHSKYDHSLDGLNTIRYNLHRVTLHRLFTLVNVTLFEESYEQINARLNIKNKEGGA